MEAVTRMRRADAPFRGAGVLKKTLDLPLETVILLIGGMAMATAGALLFFIASGVLPYYEGGFFGLLLVAPRTLICTSLTWRGGGAAGRAKLYKPLGAL